MNEVTVLRVLRELGIEPYPGEGHGHLTLRRLSYLFGFAAVIIVVAGFASVWP